MRICDLTTLYMDGAQGGVNTYLTEKARYLSTHPEVEAHAIVVPGRKSERRDLFRARVHAIKSPTLPGQRQNRVLTHFAEVRRVLDGERPSVLEVDCAYLLGEAAFKHGLARVPIVGLYHVHLPAFISRSWLPRWGRLAGHVTERLAWRYIAFCQRRCDRLVVTSPDIRSRLEAEGFSGLDHVPLGVNVELFHPRLRTRATDEARPVELLYVGRLSPEKEVDVLIDAVRILAASGRYALTIVGDGPSEPALRRRASDLACVRFLGRREYGPDIARLYADADVFASPGSNETFNLTLLEALASGVPVVAAARGGPLGLVTPEVGLLAQPGSSADFAEKIEHVAQERARYHGCREHVCARYGWDRTFERLLAVYREAIAGGGRASHARVPRFTAANLAGV